MNSLVKPVVALVLFALVSVGALADDGHSKLVLQVSDGAEQADYALGIATNFLKTEPNAAIQIVAYSKGVDFLLSGFRGKPDEVKALQAKGVVFKVCNNTLRYREIDRSRVLAGAQVVPYGAIEIARLQQQEGYAYVKP